MRSGLAAKRLPFAEEKEIDIDVAGLPAVRAEAQTNTEEDTATFIPGDSAVNAAR